MPLASPRRPNRPPLRVAMLLWGAPFLPGLASAPPAAAQTPAPPAVPHHVAHPPLRPGHAHPAGKTHIIHAGHPAHAIHRPPVPPAKPAPPPVPVPVPVPGPVVPPPAPKGTNTGLPLPRFAALRADDVNLRGGPGTRYPIQWVYKRRDLPVKIEREFDVWRLIEDSEGVKGWVHQATLVGTRSFVVTAGDGSTPPGGSDSGSETGAPARQMLRNAPAADAPVVAILKPGVIGRIRACPAASDWCKVSVKDYSGWLPRQAFWGVLAGETIQPP